MSARWQCMLITAPTAKELEAKINDRGTEGWELVAVTVPQAEAGTVGASGELFYVPEYSAWLKRHS